MRLKYQEDHIWMSRADILKITRDFGRLESNFSRLVESLSSNPICSGAIVCLEIAGGDIRNSGIVRLRYVGCVICETNSFSPTGLLYAHRPPGDGGRSGCGALAPMPPLILSANFLPFICAVDIHGSYWANSVGRVVGVVRAEGLLSERPPASCLYREMHDMLELMRHGPSMRQLMLCLLKNLNFI
jgi:hypothetical protein